MNKVYLLLGSNLQPERHLPAAIERLRAHGLAAASRVFETHPVGTRHPALFLNAAVLLETRDDPGKIKRDVCAVIEADLGRVRDPADKFAPRTIDLDIALWNEEVTTIHGSPVPDPDILRHLHAARPLADLAPGLVHPVTGHTLADIARHLERALDPSHYPRPRPDVILSVLP